MAEAATPQVTENAPTASPNVEQKNETASRETLAQANALEKRLHKIKIDDEEIEVDEDELKSGYRMRKASDKRFQEAAALRKQSLEFIEMLKDPERFPEVLQKLGHNPDEISEKYLVKKLRRDLEESKKDPKDKEIERLKSELETRTQKEKELAQTEQQKQQEEHHKKLVSEFSKDISEALAEADLPKKTATIRRMADYLRQGVMNGVKLTAKEVIPWVQKDIADEAKDFFKDLSPEAAEKILGSEFLNRLRKHDLSKIKGQRTFSTPTKPIPIAKTDKKKDIKEVMQEIRENAARLSGF